MPNYKYTARDERGQAVIGVLAAPTPEALADLLRRSGCIVTKYNEEINQAPSQAIVLPWERVSSDELVMLNVQLAKMVHVGIPLVTALNTLVQQTTNPRLLPAIQAITKGVESGASFSESLARHPAIFSPLFISMVHAGEISGKLDEILHRLATFAKRQAEVRQQLITAMTYPCILMATGVAVITFLLLGIIPKFMKIFLEAGVALPLPTRILYQMSQLLRNYGLFLLIIAALGAAAAAMALRTASGRRSWDNCLLKVPVIGELARCAAFARMTKTLETLLSSGVSILETLAIAQQTCGNTVIGDVCAQAEQSVKQGGSLSAAFRESKQCPPMVVQMVAVGESSGAVDQMLGEIASHYDELVQHSIKRLMTLIEPAFLIVLGGMIALIMASVLLPLFRMVNVVHH